MPTFFHEPSDSCGPDDPDGFGVHFDDACPICAEEREAVEAVVGLLALEIRLRTLCLDLWVAGWTPEELVRHVRSTVPDSRGADLIAHTLLVDDSHRSDQARPVEWRRQIERLRAVTGAVDQSLAAGWLGRWVRASSDRASSAELADVMQRTVDVLEELFVPSVRK